MFDLTIIECCQTAEHCRIWCFFTSVIIESIKRFERVPLHQYGSRTSWMILPAELLLGREGWPWPDPRLELSKLQQWQFYQWLSPVEDNAAFNVICMRTNTYIVIYSKWLTGREPNTLSRARHDTVTSRLCVCWQEASCCLMWSGCLFAVCKWKGKPGYWISVYC